MKVLKISMVILSLSLVCVNLQASLYCALGSKTPSQLSPSLPYVTLQIDQLDADLSRIQVYLTDYYHGRTTNSILTYSGSDQNRIDGVKAGLYISKETKETSELKYENGGIVFIFNTKTFSCEIL